MILLSQFFNIHLNDVFLFCAISITKINNKTLNTIKKFVNSKIGYIDNDILYIMMFFNIIPSKFNNDDIKTLLNNIGNNFINITNNIDVINKIYKCSTQILKHKLHNIYKNKTKYDKYVIQLNKLILLSHLNLICKFENNKCYNINNIEINVNNINNSKYCITFNNKMAFGKITPSFVVYYK